MEYSFYPDPSLFPGRNAAFSGEEESIYIIMEEEGRILSFDFEKRKLASRTTIQIISYTGRKVSSVRAAAPKLKIKSTFAPSPFASEGITFSSHGFTASLCSNGNARIHLVFAAPEMTLPDGREGFKGEIAMTEHPESPSCNVRISHRDNTELFHASALTSLSGAIRVGGEKICTFPQGTHGFRVWKKTSFPRRKEHTSISLHFPLPSGHASALVLPEEGMCVLLRDDRVERWDGIHVSYKEGCVSVEGKEISVRLSVFETTYDKAGPFSQERTTLYGNADGRIGGQKIENGMSIMRIPGKKGHRPEGYPSAKLLAEKHE